MILFRVQTEMIKYVSRSMLTVLFIANLTACGFYLAGNTSLPPQLASIELLSDNLDSSQKALLTGQLIQAGADLRDNQGAGVVRLSVTITDLPERKLADTAGSGKAIIRLFRQLSYSITTSSGEQVAAQKTILQQLDIELDSNDMSGLEYEKQSAGASLDQALIGQLINQLKHFKN